MKNKLKKLEMKFAVTSCEDSLIIFQFADASKSASPVSPPQPSGDPRRFSYEQVASSANFQQLRLLSPYSTVTQPRHSFHSSSGHGSDCSSSLFGWRWRGGGGGGGGVGCGGGSGGGGGGGEGSSRRSHRYHGGGGASSGYESMLRDSEVSSSHADSASESSASASARKRHRRKKSK